MSQTIWRLRMAYWISKTRRAQAHARARAHPPAHHTHTRTRTHASILPHTQKYVIFIAFPRQQWLCERASILRHT